MLKMILDRFKFMDIKVKKIIKYGLIFSFFISIIATAIFLTYKLYPIPELYYIGLSVFQLSLFFVVDFIICGIAIDTIKQQIC